MSFRLPMIMREHDFVGEERHPFEGVSAVGIGAAYEFMLAVGKFDEFSLTKLTDQFGAVAQWNQIF